MRFDAAINLKASDLIGARVYATEADINIEMVIGTDGEKEWDDISEINEIALTRDGQVSSVILGVGGFLGMDELQIVRDDGANDVRVYVDTFEDTLKSQPAYDG